MYKSKYPSLIDFLTKQEDLILLDSEIQNIENLVDKDLKAINYTRCWAELKDYEALTFDEYAKKFYKKTAKEYYVNKRLKSYEVTKNDLQKEYNNYCLNF